MLAGVTEPLPAKPGRPRREDYEYERAGTRNLFLTCEPRRGWRHVAITRQRTMQDFAQQMRWLVDEAYPDVPVIRLVLDNLNTHRMASLYETFPAVEARRIAKRLEFHHTPKHGSWLNMAEIEFSVLARACLRGRNGDEDSLERAVSACVSERNAIGATINWRFTAQDARRKLHRLYPCQSCFGSVLNQSKSGIYIDTGLGSAANTVIPAFAGITGTLQSVLSWTPAYAGLTKVFAPAGCII